MLEKSAGIERFKYLSLDKELRAQTEFAKKQQARRNRGAMRDVGGGGSCGVMLPLLLTVETTTTTTKSFRRSFRLPVNRHPKTSLL